MKRIVISGVNIVSGGMLSVYKDCLREMLCYCQDIEIVALVHDLKLFEEIEDIRLTYRAYPKAKSSWLQRCYHEYVLFHRLSKTLHVDLWLSMHDMTPYVKADQQVVYCHNIKLASRRFFVTRNSPCLYCSTDTFIESTCIAMPM